MLPASRLRPRFLASMLQSISSRGELDAARLKSLPGRKISLTRILASLPTQPITTYDNSAQGDSTKLGWVRPGDPRSELVLALFKETIGLSLMHNGLPKGCLSSEDDIDWLLEPPSPKRIASVSPLARLRAGQYSCPTFISTVRDGSSSCNSHLYYISYKLTSWPR